MLFALVLVAPAFSALPKSPTLAEDVTHENVTKSAIGISVERREMKLVVYRQSHGTVDAFTRSEVSYEQWSEPSWTVSFISTVTNTLTWWVVNQETDVITAEDNDAKVKVEIMTGIIVGVTVVLLLFNLCACECKGGTRSSSSSSSSRRHNAEGPQPTPEMTPAEMEAMAIANGGFQSAPVAPAYPGVQPMVMPPPTPLAPEQPAAPAAPPPDPYAPQADANLPPNPYDQADNADWD